jgi:hypothetical protein
MNVQKIAAVVCGEKMYRVCYLNNNGDWYPIWNAKTYDNFKDADNEAIAFCKKPQHNVISEYINMR